jgi:NDP-sugar pyrophosphorylase family protein
MNDMKILPDSRYGLGFVPPEFLCAGEDEYRIRDVQLKEILGREGKSYRALTRSEIEELEANGNRCVDWTLFRVTDPFVPGLVRNCEFAGLVRLGAIGPSVIEHHDFLAPVGITDSRIVACDVGDLCAIHDCSYLAHYIIGDGCVLVSNDEIHASNHSKFGNGIVMEGEDESLRVELDLMNEAGGRSVLPFEGMTCADAYLWARRRDDPDLIEAFRAMTDAMFDHRRGRYGTIGRGSVLKSNAIIKDAAIGESAYVKGANKLKNITVHSSEEERTQIGEGVELVNGIVGRGCKVFYGCKAVRFVLRPNSSLKYGARLIHSVLGENSTVSCCEMLNNLIFPCHEQHHNTSFLIAALVRGQSNLAAGATIGSNHNSRAPDGEIEAGRGFWPGLCSSVKHSSRFASFCLLSKGDYRYEIDLELPFCLVDDDRSLERLVLMPAYWWTHNLYALMRNEGKFASRDKREVKEPRLEFSPFAPDTAEEIIGAIGLIESWMKGLPADGEDADWLELPAGTVEHSSRPTVIKRPARSIAAYRDMLSWYAANAVLERLEAKAGPGGDARGAVSAEIAALEARLASSGRERVWDNLGGQIAPRSRVDELVARARSGALRDWGQMHEGYARIESAYAEDKAAHAWACLRLSFGGEAKASLRSALGRLEELSREVEEQVYATRAKDFSNRFRRATFESEAEFDAVMGLVEDNSFVKKTREQMPRLRDRIESLRALL